MSEFEFLKHSTEKYDYKLMTKNFPKNPVNSYRISNTTKIKPLNNIFKIYQSSFNIKWNVTNDSGCEITPQLKFFNGDNIDVILRNKQIGINIFTDLKQNELKNFGYSVSLNRRTKTLHNCKIDLKTKNYGNFLLTIYDYADKKKRDKNKKGENNLKGSKSSNNQHPVYIANLSFTRKFFNLIEAKLMINNNNKEMNTLELKNTHKIGNTNFKIFNFHILNFALNKDSRNLTLSKNIIGISYNFNFDKSKMEKKEEFNNEEESKVKKDDEKRKFVKSTNNFKVVTGLTFQNLNFSSFNFGIFNSQDFDKRKSSQHSHLRFPLKNLHQGIYIHLRNKNVKTEKDDLKQSENLFYSYLVQYHLKHLTGKIKISQDSIRTTHELIFNNVLDFDLFVIKKLSISLHYNMENVNLLKLDFNRKKFKYGVNLNIS